LQFIPHLENTPQLAAVGSNTLGEQRLGLTPRCEQGAGFIKVLPKINRLQKNQDFQRVFKNGKGLREDFLFLKVLENNLGIPRFGFIVSNKISKKATVRNRIKRKLRELVREKLSKIKKNIDAVIIVRAFPETKNFKEIEKVINQLFLKANLTIRNS